MHKILVIEDEFQIRQNIREILELSGFEVVVAEHGQDGLQKVRSVRPDLVLCDVMMPELDGYGFLSALRQDTTGELAALPVIFLTAKSDRVDLRHGMNLGADDYLTKPFEPNELLQAIESRLKRRETLNQQIAQAEQQAQSLKQAAYQNQQKLQESEQLAGLKTDLLQKLSQELRDPLSNINMAIHMLRRANSELDRDRYLTILQNECAREIQMLNEISDLQKILTPENTQLLKRFNLLSR